MNRATLVAAFAPGFETRTRRNGHGVRAGGDPFALLVDDHRKILGTIREMLTVESRLKRARLFLMLKRKLAKHALAEEDIVCPILHQERAEADRSKHLYDEHAG